MPLYNMFWFRRDLRLEDNAALYYALKAVIPVIPIFIFDTAILDALDDKADRRVTFIHQQITALQQKLEALGSTLLVLHGNPLQIIPQLLAQYKPKGLYTNKDYEPYAKARDTSAEAFCKAVGATYYSHKDQVIFEESEILSGTGKFYSVFTPYSRVWKAKLTPYQIKPYPTEKYFGNFWKQQPFTLPTLESLGFKDTGADGIPAPDINLSIIDNYEAKRNFPGIKGTTHLSVHLRFGTLSIRQLVATAQQHSETWLNELIWRDFYHQVLFHNPQTATRSFKPEYDNIKWRNNMEDFTAWCNGKTGYPIVDAGMIQLNTTGYMHNRVRMVVASFLCKHLLIDWRWGEAYFAQKLIDYDMAANVGGWQWAAGSGCDAAPYFRVFNPTLQAEKFDKGNTYINKYVKTPTTTPMVDHAFARKRCLEVYGDALKK